MGQGNVAYVFVWRGWEGLLCVCVSVLPLCPVDPLARLKKMLKWGWGGGFCWKGVLVEMGARRWKGVHFTRAFGEALVVMYLGVHSPKALQQVLSHCYDFFRGVTRGLHLERAHLQPPRS